MTHYDYYIYQDSIAQLREVWQYLIPVMIFLLIIWLISVAEYFFRAYAIHSISKKQGVANGWLGYIPIARDYQLGAIAGDLEFGKRKIKNTGLWLVITPIIMGTVIYFVSLALFFPLNIAMIAASGAEDVAGFISVFYIAFVIYIFIAVIAQAAIYVLRGAALHKLFSKYSQKQMPVVYAIISLFVPLGETICLLIHRKKAPLDEQSDSCQPVQVAALPQEADVANVSEPVEKADGGDKDSENGEDDSSV